MKYGNKKLICPKHGKFDSRGEYNHYLYLKELHRTGEITILDRQVTFQIVINGHKVFKVIPDYRYTLKTGETIVADFKGLLTPLSKLKYKILKADQGIDVLIVRKPGEKIR